MPKICEKCGAELKENDKFCDKCGAKIKVTPKAENKKISSTISLMDNKKIIIGILVLVIAVIVVGIGAMTLMDMNKQQIIIPDEYTLESNESGVETYVNNLSNGYKLEIKEEGNSNGIKQEDMYGTVMKCTVDGKHYVLTCYMPVDKSKDVVVDSRNPDITAHPGVQKVQGYHQYGSSVSNGIVEFSRNTPYDMKVLQDMNRTGHLNVTYFQQTFAPTYMDAIDAIDARDMAESLDRLAYRWGI